jgi:hypothetical protein
MEEYDEIAADWCRWTEAASIDLMDYGRGSEESPPK